MKKTVVIILAVMSASAFAGGRESVYVKNHGPSDNYNDFPNVAQSIAKSSSESSALSVSEGGSAFAYGGKGVGMGGNSSSGGNTLQVNEAAIPDKITIRQVPSFGVADIHPTAGCMGGASLSLATGFFGIGGGKSYINEDCVRQELARYYAQQGRADVGNEILCKSKYMKGVSVCGGR